MKFNTVLFAAAKFVLVLAAGLAVGCSAGVVASVPPQTQEKPAELIMLDSLLPGEQGVLFQDAAPEPKKRLESKPMRNPALSLGTRPSDGERLTAAAR